MQSLLQRSSVRGAMLAAIGLPATLQAAEVVFTSWSAGRNERKCRLG